MQYHYCYNLAVNKNKLKFSKLRKATHLQHISSHNKECLDIYSAHKKSGDRVSETV